MCSENIPIAFNQDMQTYPSQADRGVMANGIRGGIAQNRPVDDGDAAAAYHLQRIVWTDERGRILIQPDAGPKWDGGHRRERAPESIPLAKVLVDNKAADETQAWCQIDHPRAGRGPALPAGDHSRGHGGGPGRGAGYVHAVRVAVTKLVRRCRVAQHLGEAHLVAPGHEDPVSAIEHLQVSLRLAVGAGLERQDAHAISPETAEHGLIEIPRIIQ